MIYMRNHNRDMFFWLTVAILAAVFWLAMAFLPAYAQTVSDVRLGPPRVETVGTPPIAFGWSEVLTTGTTLDSCATRQDFNALYGAHNLDPVTGPIVYWTMGVAGDGYVADTKLAHIANLAGSGTPVMFNVEYILEGAGCRALELVVSP